MLLYYECPTPIFHFAKRRNRTHHHRAEHKPGGNSDDAGGGHNRSYRTAEYQPLLRRIFDCAFFIIVEVLQPTETSKKQFEISEVEQCRKLFLKNFYI